MATTADRCVCGHTRYMHNPEENNRCCVSDHLQLVCTCGEFSLAAMNHLAYTNVLDVAARNTVWVNRTGLIWAWRRFNCCTKHENPETQWHFWSKENAGWQVGGVLAQTDEFTFGGPFTQHAGQLPGDSNG